MRKYWVVGFAFVLVALFVYRVRNVLTPFLFAAIIAYILYPLVNVFEKRSVPRSIAIILVYLILGTIFGVVFWIIVPQFARQLDELLVILSSQVDIFEKLGGDAVQSFQKLRLPVTIHEVITLIATRLQTWLGELVTRFASLLMSTVAHIIALVIAPVLAFYLLRDHEILKERIFLYVPIDFRTDFKGIMREINKTLNGFFRGQILISAVIGFTVYVGLAILGVQYALVIGIIAGLFDIIPYFGPIIGFIPAAAFAMIKSPIYIVWVAIIFIGANQLESSIIAPKIIGDRVGLHPLAVIFAVLTGAELMGVVGMLIAVPVAAIIRVLIHHFASKYRGTPM